MGIKKYIYSSKAHLHHLIMYLPAQINLFIYLLIFMNTSKKTVESLEISEIMMTLSTIVTDICLITLISS
jgi:hypothetical protein